jgi:tRNA (adenine22-N1)-methyltransferase
MGNDPGMIKLSKRLSTAAGMMIPGNRLADVGTDHGWVPVYLVQTGAIPSALAMDIGKGPLQRAQEHIEEYGLSDRIECRLSDGLAAYDKGECDTVLIAGMGGELIIDILKKGREKLTDGMQLILSPHTHAELVREYVDSCGYKLMDEICVYDEGKYYFLMDVRVEIGKTRESDSSVGYFISHILVEKKDPVYLEYLKAQLAKYRNILENTGLGADRRAELEKMAGVYAETVAGFSDSVIYRN